MGLEWNNVKPACCAKWLVLPTVYSDALSYGEQLDKFCYQLNQLIENNNILPDFIAEMIKEYINSGAIGEVVRDILANYILNVKYPPKGITPAVGDGSADDTEAIQGCIDYAAENGGVVYFPYGDYLSQPLTMKSGVSLFGFDRYSTKIVLKGGATKPLIGGSPVDLSITNLTLDGNAGIQVNDVNVITIMGTNVLLDNLIIKDGYTLINYIGTDGHLQISNIVFGNAVEKCLLTTGNADVQCENVLFNQLSSVGGKSVLDIGTDGGFYSIKSRATCNQCIVISGNNNKVSAIVENASIPVTDNGLQNNIEIFGVSNKEFYSGDTTKEVTGTYSKHVGGTYTKAIDGNSTESYDGTYAKIITGVSSETFKGDRVITEENESVTGKRKVVNVDSYEVNADSVKLTGNDVILNPTNPLTYKTPDELNRYFKSVPMKNSDGIEYEVLVYNDANLQYYNVKDYGAKGDGVSDDTNAIQKCFDSAMLNKGGKVIFPAGVYCVSKTLVIRPHTAAIHPDDNQMIHFIPMDRLELAGEGEVTLKATAIMDWVIATNDLSYPENVGSFSNFYTHIHGLKIDGNEKANGGINVYNALHSLVEFNQIFGVKMCMQIYGYGDCTVFKNTLRGTKGCLMPKGSGDSYIYNNDIYLTDNGIGFELTGYAGSTSFVKNTFTPINSGNESINNETIAISAYNTKGNNYFTGPLFIHENSFDGMKTPVKLYSVPSNFVTGVQVYANKFANLGTAKGDYLVEALGVNNIMINDNNIGVSYEYLGAVNGVAKLTKCTNVIIDGNLTPATNKDSIVLYECNSCYVTNNKINSPALTGDCAIKIEGNSYNNVVKNNYVTKGISNLTKGILEVSPADYNVIIDNRFKEIVERLVKAGSSTVAKNTETMYDIPTSETWLKGDVVYCADPASKDSTFCWVCVDGGTPGTWKAVKYEP